MQGEAVGSKAHVTELRRESSGQFNVADAWQLDTLLGVSKEMGLARPPRPRQQRRKKKSARQPAARTEAQHPDGSQDLRSTDSASSLQDASSF